MAVTESVKIVFEVDDKALVSTVAQLQAVGKVSQEDAAKFNELSTASKNASASLSDAASGADKFASAGKKISESVKDTNDSLKQIPSASKPLKDLGNDANNTSTKFVSLKTRLKEAKDEVERLANQGFSPLSKEVLSAQNRAGALADELGDLNRQVNLLNPESKVQAFTNFGQGIVGAFQIATGALQAFGVENERVQQIAQRLQGALNVAQGVQSIIQLKEAFSDLSVVVSSSAAAIETISSGAKGIELLGEAASSASDSSDALTDSLESAIGAAGNSASVIGAYNKTQKTTEQVTNAATTSTKGFNAALKANPAFFIATAIGALVGALVLLKDSTKDAAQTEEDFKNIKEDSKDATNGLKDAEDELAISRNKSAKFDIDRRKNFEALQKDLLKLYDNQRIAQQELNKAEEEFNELGVGAGKSVVAERKARLDAARQQKTTTDQAIKDRIKEFNINGQIITQKQIESELDQNKSVETKKQADSISLVNKNRQDSIKLVTDEIALLEEAQRGALIGVDDEIQRIAITDSFRKQITVKQIERAKLTGESITLIEQKAANDQLQSFEDLFAAVEAARDKDVSDAEKAAEDKLAAEKKTLDGIEALLNQEEALKLLQNQVNATSDADLAEKNFNTQKDFLEQRIALQEKGSLKEQQLLAELAILTKNYEQGKTDETAKGEAERAELRRKQIDQGFEIANAATDLIIEANQRQYEEELTSLEDARERGVLTEEQYEARVKKIKQKAAEDQKKAQIFQATMSAAQAILSAAAGVYLTPGARIAAIAFAATIGALNLAKIIATPIPKFKKGTLAVPGYDTGDDSVHALLRPGEAVIPTEINREYASAIKAIYTRKVSSKELNEFVESRSRMTVVQDEPVFNFNPVTMDALFKRDLRVSRISSAVDRASGGIMPTINVKADVDTYALSKAMSKNRGVELTNPEQVAKALATELNKTNNRRRQ